MVSCIGFGQHPPPCPRSARGWQIYRNPTKPTSACRLA
ncbi:rCG61133 [Rattus norvegicus]|uniref:RCG61133 n=1 Tax=Rattus norvegicus TaxID=10116 RepID=A6KE69_RAT|nr:rCG61133 [Rattus norvegicus]